MRGLEVVTISVEEGANMRCVELASLHVSQFIDASFRGPEPWSENRLYIQAVCMRDYKFAVKMTLSGVEQEDFYHWNLATEKIEEYDPDDEPYEIIAKDIILALSRIEPGLNASPQAVSAIIQCLKEKEGV